MIVPFQPQGDTRGNGALGMTDADGRNTLTERRSAPGAHVGEYRISFYPSLGSKKLNEAADVASTGRGSSIPAVSIDPSPSPLRATVPQGGGTPERTLSGKSSPGAGRLYSSGAPAGPRGGRAHARSTQDG